MEASVSKWEKSNAARREKYKKDPKYRAKVRAAQETPHGRFIKLKADAKFRGLEMTLTESEYTELISKPCFYCGGAISSKGSGTDRINSEVGYVSGNVRPCCGNCNQSKNDLTEDEFKQHILQIYNHWIH